MNLLILLLFFLKISFARSFNLNEHPISIELSCSFNDINNITHIPNTSNTSNYSLNPNFGFTYTYDNAFTIKFGIEGIYLAKINNIIIDSNTTANSLYYAYSPYTGFELLFYKTTSSKAYFGSNFFYSYFKGTNNIKDNLNTYKDTLSSNKFSYEPLIGYETSFIDKYTLFFNLSYKLLYFKELAVKTTGSNIDYSELKLDFSGLAFKIGFRLYL